jgi:hypothetical protein
MSKNYEEFKRVNDKDSAIEQAVMSYQNGKADLHVVGAQVLFHLYSHGDVGPINKLWKSLGTDTREFQKFKLWAGQMTRLDCDGEITNTLTFKKDDGFRLAKNTGPARKMLSWIGDYDKLEQSCANFLDFKKDKGDKPEPNVFKLLTRINKMVGDIDAASEEYGVPIPKDIQASLDNLKEKLSRIDIKSFKDVPNVNLKAEGIDEGHIAH